MKVNSWLLDKKIHGINVSVEFSIDEYWMFANDILTSNDLQRKRVSAKGKTYELLARDLIEGCIMPPIILAISNEANNDVIQQIIGECLTAGEVAPSSQAGLQSLIEKSISERHLIILDGLQRTYTISDCMRSHSGNEAFTRQKIRTEIYIGLSKSGILYRMITLNTGQTPMSLRQQIEMLYQDYSNNPILMENGVQLLKESGDSKASRLGEYKLSDAADMYYAYTTASPNSYTKQSISTILRESEFLENFVLKETDELSDIVLSYHKLITKLNDLFPDWELYKKEESIDPDFTPPLGSKTPFARNVASIGSKVQVMAGFSSAISKLIKAKILEDINDVNTLIDGLTSTPDNKCPLTLLIEMLDEIRSGSNRVGDSQRAYFNLLFKHLFNKDHDSHLDLRESIISARDSYDNTY